MTLENMELDQKLELLMKEQRHEEAEILLRQQLATGTGPLSLWQNLARVIRAQGRIAEARDLQQQIVDAFPGDTVARFDLAESLLLLGDFARGWKEYRWRYQQPHTHSFERRVQHPRWNGSPIPGKTLLIHDEQGFGDSLQFLRLVSRAKTLSGANILLEVTPPLLPIASRMGCFDAIASRGDLLPAFDMHCELMSLPFVTKLAIDDLPGPVPYLSPDPERVAFWRKRLEWLPRPLVALVWAGNPSHANDANRSMQLSELAPLASLGLTFVAVQKGPAAKQAVGAPGGLKIELINRDINDFDDTAAILEVADLLISVDSAPVHLAGALGRPAWALLPFVPDWRWLLDRDDTPWYPSLRLFRQKRRGDWSTVVSKLCDALAAFRG
ncbi:glycosyltransferase family 9 protein [Cohaesibacter haloalkalitolerans]|uniref:glycosyltransferase family 9 protein n=1 Tax=Cohaesibacter haloalkalitolerans TaxID=1162980 RepID=UPI000E65C586|nr:glycosyltransferase family 9 protein [Cohaesibacter haloalkalitolerans]